MIIPDPEFYPSRISDPTAPKRKEEGKKIFGPTIFVATNIIK